MKLNHSVLSAAALALAGAALVAGPLTPPGGPVASTYKTLNEIEPRIPVGPTTTPGDADSVYRISQPGSYYLTGDVVGQSGKDGIEIAAENITLDLNGFTLRGVPGSKAGIDANETPSPYCTIKNGHVQGWGQDGLLGNLVGAWVITDVKFRNNSGNGMTINSGTVCTRCYFTGNSLSGCGTSNHVEFHQCFGSQNGQHGFAAGSDSQFVGCEATSNGGTGIVVPLGGRVIGCTTTLNNNVGIFVGDGGQVMDCHVDTNLQGGIIVGKGGNVFRCAVNGNGTTTSHYGIQARFYSTTAVTTATIGDCIVTANTGTGIQTAGGTIHGCMAESNGNNGIWMSGRGVISECTAASNTGIGIIGGNSVQVLHCTSGNNTTHGIQVSSDCLVRGNSCDSNGTAVANGAGIYIPSAILPFANSDNRIEENNCSDADYGILVSYSGNFIARNSCTGNTTNYSISANNTKGTIVNAAAVDITTSNSFANFEY